MLLLLLKNLVSQICRRSSKCGFGSGQVWVGAGLTVTFLGGSFAPSAPLPAGFWIGGRSEHTGENPFRSSSNPCTHDTNFIRHNNQF